MGKKNRRKKVNKKERKDQLEERRERLHEIVDRDDDSEHQNGDDAHQRVSEISIEVGSRVAYATDGSREMRGIVKDIPSEGHYLVLPVDKADKSYSYVLLEESKMIRDDKEWTTRFKVGDSIVFLCPSNRWVTGSITGILRCHFGEGVVSTYTCMQDGILDTEYSILPDTDNEVMARPQSFRFSVGDDVVFASSLAAGVQSSRIGEAWIRGKISRVDIVGRSDYYAAYECSYIDRKRNCKCHVLKDNDEHITSLTSTPRERLFESIEQDCSYKHIDNLIKSSGLDVMAFRDIFLSKSIENASYSALLWLQENAKFDLTRICDEEGNRLLHQIAKSPRPERFFSAAASTAWRNINTRSYSSDPIIYLGRTFDIPEQRLLQQTNNEGRTFLHELIISGNKRALDIVLSPTRELAWLLGSCYIDLGFKSSEPESIVNIMTRDKNGRNLKDTAHLLGRLEMEKMIDEFEEWHMVYELSLRLSRRDRLRNFEKIDLPSAISRFGGKHTPASLAKRIIRFYDEWNEQNSEFLINKCIGDAVSSLCIVGQHDAVSWLVDADPALLNATYEFNVPAVLHKDAFIQFTQENEAKEGIEVLDLVGCSTFGKAVPYRYGGTAATFDDDSRKLYISTLEDYKRLISCKASYHNGLSLAGFIEDQAGEYAGSFKAMLLIKRELLQDGQSLQDRLKLLDFLVQQNGLPPPNVLSVVRWRQCGILRWLVKNGFVNLDEAANGNVDILKKGKDLPFLSGRTIPRDMSVGVFLCLAAIEFDDLQSFQWLVEKQKICLTSIMLDGLNVLHLCAILGRAEIVLCLVQSQPRSTLKSLLEIECTQLPWNGYYAAHIAAEKGFTFLSDVFLSLDCPYRTSLGKTVLNVASMSSFRCVRDWGAEMEKPIQLEKDIRRLVHLLATEIPSIDGIVRHIVQSKCMDYSSWIECRLSTVDEQGPLGKSYREIMQQCCSLDDPTFIVWLCQELSPSSIGTNSTDEGTWDKFWLYDESVEAGRLDGLALRVKFVFGGADRFIYKMLNSNWARDVTCNEPSQRSHVLRTMLLFIPLTSSAFMELKKFSNKLLRIDAVRKIMNKATDELERRFAQGMEVEYIRGMIETILNLASELAGLLDCKVEECFADSRVILPGGSINLEANLHCCQYGENHPLRHVVDRWDKAPLGLSRLYIVLAVEGYCQLIKWIHSTGRSTGSSHRENSMVRIAAYMGHRDIVNYFLRRNGSECFCSDLSDCYQEAILGVIEAGKVGDLQALSAGCNHECFALDPLITYSEKNDIITDWKQEMIRRKDIFVSSLLVALVSGCLRNSRYYNEHSVHDEMGESHEAILTWMVEEGHTDANILLKAVKVYAKNRMDARPFVLQGCRTLVCFLVNELSIDISGCHENINDISLAFLNYVHMCINDPDFDSLVTDIAKWLEFSSSVGVDVQLLKDENGNSDNAKDREKLKRVLPFYQANQVRGWSQFDPIKEGGSLVDLQLMVEDGAFDLSLRCQGGFLATHLAAAYDRVDVLQWLVQEKDMRLDARDARGRDVLQVANDSDAKAVSEWIALATTGNVIAGFVSSNFRRQRANRTKVALLRSIVMIQAWQRGNEVRRSYRGRLLSRLDEMQRYQEIWGASMMIVSSRSLLDSDCSWQAIKQREHDIMRAADCVEDEDILTDTSQKLEEAAARALRSCDVSTPSEPTQHGSRNEDQNGSSNEADAKLAPDPEEMSHRDFAKILMTQDVTKWLRRGDSKYREFFIRRIKQLAAGDRSRILAKRLAGSKTLIYETYLEQKSGHRILWTENEGDSLLIWYVAKHKSVSRLITLIDDAENRSSRQLISASSLGDVAWNTDIDFANNNRDEDRIMLDPLGDTPLKLFEVDSDEIERLSDPTWKPRLFLTSKEREVVETCGTVLLLGRSGTGKTCVIGNRMDYDRQRAGNDSRFSQLFVARSKGLCDYVKEAVDGGDGAEMNFETFNVIASSLEEKLPPLGEGKNGLFLPSSKMDFRRFKRDFYRPALSSGDLDALVLWTNIRSFIKGSIEALQCADKVLSEEEYLSLGKKRCRLSLEQRKFVYSAFLRYQTYLMELGLWDDCDRITAVVKRLNHARMTDSPEYQQVRYSKVYVDEVQDYTQAEIALFFYLCGPGDLFLAGDPAQSVVEGVEFRFEEIRSVGYHLYGKDRRHLIPEKPKTVHINFRSHCGILNVAAAVLSCLFEAFPDSAKQLKEDRGLFQGPRPGVFYKVAIPRLSELVSKRNGIVVLTHDRNVTKWSRALGDYPLVYGIREAKGLEFQEVILVDFFRDIPASLQKLWRDLLLGRDQSDISLRPEIEGHLKLLYTATTRCIQRLYFAETTSSLAGDAFVRWLTTTTTARSVETEKGKEALAVRSSVESVEKMTRTPDEWRSAGLDNAVMAESADELIEKETWLDRALYCFEQVEDNELASRARTHRLGIQFQLALEDKDASIADDAGREIEAALVTEQLLKECLFSEARAVCCAILPFLGERAQETLRGRLISELPSYGETL